MNKEDLIKRIEDLSNENNYESITLLLTKDNMSSPKIRAKLKQIFSQIDDERVITELANSMEISATSTHGAISAMMLCYIGKPQVIPHVMSALDKGGGLSLLPSINQTTLKKEVFIIIKSIGVSAVEPLLQELDHRAEYISAREFIGKALNEIATQESIPLLLEYFNSERIEIREVVATTLNALDWQPENNQQKIIFLIAIHSWDELVGIDDPAVVNYLTKLLVDNQYSDEVIKVLGQIGDQRAINPILDHLKNANLIQRAKHESYVDALTSIAKQHRDSVKIALQDSHRKTKKVAKLVLKKI